MKLKAQLGCKNCNAFEEKVIKLPFDCDNFVCINCGESNSLFVASVLSEIKSNENDMDESLFHNLYNMHNFC